MLGVSRQVYYRYCRSKQKKQDKAEQVLTMVRPIRKNMPRIGFRKLYYLLYEPLIELHVGRDKFLSILKANQMLIKPKRNYRITTDSHHRFRKHKNLVADIELTHPEQVWVSDITYIGGRNRNCYLALVTDAYSKKIMGYDVSNSLSTESSLRALNMAIRQKRYKNKLIHHSDRGLQYCSNDYQNVLKKKKIIPSMTEHYDPYANAIAERVNGILKQEFFLEDYLVDIKTMKLLVEDAETVN
nr:IS3 family transposase [Microbacter margulisiae]